MEDLQEFAKGEAEKYNAKMGGERVIVSEVLIEGNTAKVIYSYDSDASLIDFARESQDASFSLESLSIRTVEEVLLTETGQRIPEEYAKRKKLHVALVEGSGSFITEGKILQVVVDGPAVESADNHVRLPEGNHLIIYD